MKTFVFSILLFVSSISFGQDIIVPITGDTIHCKINTILENNIYYTIHTIERNKHANISLMDVHMYRKSGEQIIVNPKKDFIQYEKVEEEASLPAVNNGGALESIFKPSKVRLSISGGFAVRTVLLSDSLPSGFENYYRGLYSGIVLGIDGVCFFSKKSGIGLKYSSFKNNSELDNVYFTDSLGNRSDLFTISEDVSISIVSPVYYFRLMSRSNRNVITFKGGLGYTKWEDRIEYGEFFEEYTGSTANLSLGAEYDYQVDGVFFVGVFVAIDTAIITSYEVYNGSTRRNVSALTGNSEDISKYNIGIAVGVSF